jgi:hypothetical protein
MYKRYVDDFLIMEVVMARLGDVLDLDTDIG